MFSISANIDNPFTNNQFVNIWDRNWAISKNKTLEMELLHHNSLFTISLDVQFWGQDHAGPSFSIGLFNYEWSIRLYDNRHWDYTHKCWEV